VLAPVRTHVPAPSLTTLTAAVVLLPRVAASVLLPVLLPMSFSVRSLAAVP